MFKISLRKFIYPKIWNQFNFGTLKPFVLPDLGEKIKDAKIKKWYVKEGDMVEEFQTLADVATDKLFTQLPSSETGKVHKIYFKEEEDCEVGQVLLEIEIESNAKTGEVIGENQVALPEEVIKPEHRIIYNTSDKIQYRGNLQISDEFQATTAVRSLAKKHSVNLQEVKGTGKRGRILQEDIQKHIETSKQNVKIEQKQIKKIQQSKVNSENGKMIETIIISKMNEFQKGMQKSMTQAKTIPHFYFSDEIDVSKLMNFRTQIKKHTNTNITLMTLIIKAFSLALLDYPIINSSYNPETPYEYTIHKNHNINIAIASENGLVVPNIKNCQSLSILQIQQEINRLRDIASKAQVTAQDLFGGTVTISNVGNIGGTYTAPIILPQQVCIVGIGKVLNEVRFENPLNGDFELKNAKIMNISFGCDHRILDGATVANFSNKWKTYLENPELMSLYMK